MAQKSFDIGWALLDPQQVKKGKFETNWVPNSKSSQVLIFPTRELARKDILKYGNFETGKAIIRKVKITLA